jgi:hypothetical protein
VVESAVAQAGSVGTGGAPCGSAAGWFLDIEGRSGISGSEWPAGGGTESSSSEAFAIWNSLPPALCRTMSSDSSTWNPPLALPAGSPVSS